MEHVIDNAYKSAEYNSKHAYNLLHTMGNMYKNLFTTVTTVIKDHAKCSMPMEYNMKRHTIIEYGSNNVYSLI